MSDSCGGFARNFAAFLRYFEAVSGSFLTKSAKNFELLLLSLDFGLVAISMASEAASESDFESKAR